MTDYYDEIYSVKERIQGIIDDIPEKSKYKYIINEIIRLVDKKNEYERWMEMDCQREYYENPTITETGRTTSDGSPIYIDEYGHEQI